MKYRASKIRVNDISVIFNDGSTETIPSLNIAYISINKDFFNSFLPIGNIKCLINYDLYLKIDIDKFEVPITNDTLDRVNDFYLYKKLFKGIFININNGDTTPNLNEKIANREYGTTDDTRNEFEKDNIELYLLLFKESSLQYRKVNNYVFSKCSMCSSILALLVLTQNEKILMTFPDNNKVYDNDIIIPNGLTFIGAIKYLQNKYGLYNNDYLLFDDLDGMYLLDKSLECNAFRKGETKRVYINLQDLVDNEGITYGQYYDKKKLTMTINPASIPSISNNDMSTNQILYNKIIGIDKNTGKTNVIDLDLTNKSEDDKPKILYYSNEYVLNSSIHSIQLNNYTIIINFNEIDISLFKPNKEFFISINVDKYKKMSGLVKLSKVLAVYEKQDDDSFKCMIRAEFKKDA